MRETGSDGRLTDFACLALPLKSPFFYPVGEYDERESNDQDRTHDHEYLGCFKPRVCVHDINVQEV